MAIPTTWPTFSERTVGAVQTVSFTASDDILYPVDTLTNPATTLFVSPATFGSGATLGAVTVTTGAVTAVAAMVSGGTDYTASAIAVVGNDGGNTATLAFTVAGGILTAITGYPTGGNGYIPGDYIPVAGGTGGFVKIVSVDNNGGITSAVLCTAAGVTAATSGTGYTNGAQSLVVGDAGTRALISFTSTNGVLSAPVIVSAGSGLPAAPSARIFAGSRIGQVVAITDGNAQNWPVNNPVFNPGYQIMEKVRGVPFFFQLSYPQTIEFTPLGWQRI